MKSETTYKTEDLGNNETRSYGVFPPVGNNELWLAMTRCQSKWFKTERGAKNWVKRMAPNIAEELGY